MTCTHCGAELAPGSAFCPGCGQPQQPQRSARPSYSPNRPQPIGGQTPPYPSVQQASAPRQTPQQTYPPRQNPQPAYPPRQTQQPAYSPQPPAGGMPYVAPQKQPVNLETNPPMFKSPYVKGAWFAPAAVLLGMGLNLAVRFFTDVNLSEKHHISLESGSVWNLLVYVLPTVFLCVVSFGLYFLAYGYAESRQRNARVAIAFVPIAMTAVFGYATNFLYNLVAALVAGQSLEGMFSRPLFIAGMIVPVPICMLVSYAAVRSQQKRLDSAEWYIAHQKANGIQTPPEQRKLIQNGAWFAPAAVVFVCVSTILMSYVPGFLMSFFFHGYTYSDFTKDDIPSNYLFGSESVTLFFLRAFFDCLVPAVILCLACFIFYQVAYFRLKKAHLVPRLVVMLVPMAFVGFFNSLSSGLIGFIFGINQDSAAGNAPSAATLMIIYAAVLLVCALGSYFVVRALQKKLDPIMP